MNEILGSIEGYWSRAQVYFTAEVCSNILDLLAFLLVTPEFLPPERRLHIARMVGHVGLLLTRFLSSSASVLVYKIMGFPFFTVVMLGVVLIYKSIVKYIIGLMPHGLALIMEACVIGLAIDHVRRGGGNSGVIEVTMGHAARGVASSR